MRAANADLLEIVVACIAEAILSIECGILWAIHINTFSTANDCVFRAYSHAGSIGEDWVTNTIGANSLGNEKVVEADGIDCICVDWTDLQLERVKGGSE